MRSDGPNDLVLRSLKAGKPMNDGNLLNRFIKPAAKALKLGRVNWRSLRTSCATWMVRGGANPKSVQGQLRHSRISTTWEIYAQFVPEGQRQAVEQMNEYVKRVRQEKRARGWYEACYSLGTIKSFSTMQTDTGIRRKKGLWTEKGRQELESLSLMPWTTRRRQELLELLDQLDPNVDELSQAIEQEAERMPEVKLLMTHPGVGPITAMAFVLVIGTPERFGCGKQVASYLGLIPCEASSAERWRLGHISKQGNKLLRFLLGQSAQSVARCEEQWHRQYAHLSLRRNKLIAKVAMARKLAVRLFWVWRKGWDYQQLGSD